MSSVHEILEDLSFMDINNESSFGNSDTESNWDADGDEYGDADGDEYGVRVAVGGVEIFPPPIDEDIPVVDVDVGGPAVDDADADLDFVDEGISVEIPNTPREMVYREKLSQPIAHYRPSVTTLLSYFIIRGGAYSKSCGTFMFDVPF
ncbi:hypothetical protein JTB14_029037 [Gonioctena quinquepunctata]|nr:hypothetical protein JTB14_029037 [Gonioctena quinquepunctata]